jgi:purine-binding chemotaxis protein CheW
MSDANTRRILEDRARQLARRTSYDRNATFGVDMLTFALGRERFAIESRYVYAAFPLHELVPLPGATPPVVGLTRWRGDVLTVADLRRLVGLTTGALDDLSRVIVVGDSGPELGILADTLSDIESIDPSQLFATSSDRHGETQLLLRGLTPDAVHVIDVVALLARQSPTRSSTELTMQNLTSLNSPSSDSDS